MPNIQIARISKFFIESNWFQVFLEVWRLISFYFLQLTFFPDRASSPLVTIEHPTGDTLGMDKDTNTATARHGLNPNDQSFYVIENSTTSLAVAAVK